jgi:uncharacterized membrane-anchored protein YhcB (DUF1043 family)
MNKTTYAALVVGLIICFVVFILSGTRMMNGGFMNGGMNGIGWGGQSGIWIIAIISLFIGIGIGWLIFNKKK